MDGRFLLIQLSIFWLLCDFGYSSAASATTGQKDYEVTVAKIDITKSGDEKILAQQYKYKELTITGNLTIEKGTDSGLELLYVVRYIKGSLIIRNTGLKNTDMFYHSLQVEGDVIVTGNTQLKDLNGIVASLARSGTKPKIEIHSNHPDSFANETFVNRLREEYALKTEYVKVDNTPVITHPHFRIELGSEICTYAEAIVTGPKKCRILNGDINISGHKVLPSGVPKLSSVREVRGCISIEDNTATLHGLNFLENLESIKCEKKDKPALSIRKNTNLGTLATFKFFWFLSCKIKECVLLGEDMLTAQNFKSNMNYFSIAMGSSSKFKIVPKESAIDSTTPASSSSADIPILVVILILLISAVVLVVLWMFVFKWHRDKKTRTAIQEEKLQKEKDKSASNSAESVKSKNSNEFAKSKNTAESAKAKPKTGSK